MDAYISNDNLEQVIKLYEEGCWDAGSILIRGINAKRVFNHFKNLPMTWTCRNIAIKMCISQGLLQNVIDLLPTSPTEEYLLECLVAAVINLQVPVIAHLLNIGAPLNECHTFFPLEACIVEGNRIPHDSSLVTEVARILLDRGADPNIAPLSCFGPDKSLLHLAITFRLEDIAVLLLERGADSERCDGNGLSPRTLAQVKGLTRVVEYIDSLGQIPVTKGVIGPE